MFWNNECKKISKKIWLPPLIDNSQYHRDNDFKCNNKYISFNRYDLLENIDINNIFEFNDIPLINNSSNKNKLRKQLLFKENRRKEKEIDKYKKKHKHNHKHKNKYKNGSKSGSKNTVIDKNIMNKINNKHKLMLKKIDIKVNQIDQLVRSYRTQIYPSKRQQRILKKWFYDTKMIYNKLVCFYNRLHENSIKIIEEKYPNDPYKHQKLAKIILRNKVFPISFKRLRNLKIEDLKNEFPDIPFCVISDIIKEFISNIKGNLTKMKENQITDFKFKYRKYDSKISTIPLESHYTTNKGFYPSIFGEIKVKDKNFNWKNIKHDYKLIYEKYQNKYFIQIPKYINKIEKQENKYELGVMDPGECIFQTLYGFDHLINIGENLRNIILEHLYEIDKMKAMIKTGKKYSYKKRKYKKIRKGRIKRAINKHHIKLQHIQEELHHKTCIYLCEKYKRIIITDFSSKKVSSKKKDLDVETKRVLQKLSHYKFRQLLQQKCEKYGCQYIKVNESFTTITCTNCGNIDKNACIKRTYKCKKCGIIINRDNNGSRNIFLKNYKEVIKKIK